MEPCVTIASHLMEEHISQIEDAVGKALSIQVERLDGKEGEEDDCGDEEKEGVVGGDGSATLGHMFSPGGESCPDSCYDSDASSVSSSHHSSLKLDLDGHSDVSRTTSDTLAAEHDVDDLTATTQKAALAAQFSGNADTTCQLSESGTSTQSCLMSQPEYASRVEYALKLGYREAEIASVFAKLGYHIDQNTLLNELIGLTSTQGSDIEDEEEEEEEKKKTGSVEDLSQTEDVERSFQDILSAVTRDDQDRDSKDDNLRPIVIDGSNVAMQ